MKNLLFTFLLLFLLLPLSAQEVYVPDLSSIGPNDTIPNDSLIISEVYIRSHRLADNGTNYQKRWSYVELTNMSTQPLDLNTYFLKGKGFTGSIDMLNQNKLNLKGILQPKESYLVVIPFNTATIYVDGEGRPLYGDGWHANKEILDMADTISTWIQHTNSWEYILQNRYRHPVSGAIDSAFVDCFGNDSKVNNKQVAGILSTNNNRSAWDYVWVRRTLIEHGGMDWNKARGTDLSDSEWMPIPYDKMYKYTDKAFSTVKVHGKYVTENFIKSNGKVSINHNTKIITIPYGVRRDSVFREFIYEPNVGWDLKINEDTSQYYMQTGDTLEFYIVEDSLAVKQYAVDVSEDMSAEAYVRPLIYNVGLKKWQHNWEVSTGVELMDSIGPLPFATPVDTFLKYTVFDGEVKILYGDGVSAEIKEADIIQVTSPNGKVVKKYTVYVEPCCPSQDALLKTVIFPGVDLCENPETFLYTDTLLTFLESSTHYIIELPEGTTSAPNILAVSKDPNSNIINNALKYTQDRVDVVLVKIEDDVSIAVRDNGEGGSSEDLKIVFKPFFQTGHSKQDSIGMGLGLSITKSLTDLLGWGIYFDSQLQQGSEIRIVIPHFSVKDDALFAPSSPLLEELNQKEQTCLEQELQSELTLSTKKYSILLVDDNPDILAFIKQELKQEHNIYTAIDSDHAIEKLKNTDVDLIVTDIMMPSIDGLELCNILKNDINTSHIPIVMLTAKTNIEDKQKSLEYGADAYIEKPFTIDFLNAQINNIFTNQDKLKKSFTYLPFETHGKVVRNKSDDNFLNQLNNYIYENLSNADISIDDLCGVLNVGRTSLFLKIKAISGLSPIDYFRLIRLKKAAALLRDGNYRINEVAYLVGFNTPSYFSKCFFKQFGILPNDFMKS